MIRWPAGLDAIRATFGDERRYLLPDDPQRISDAWAATILHPVDLPAPLRLIRDPSQSPAQARRIYCHELVAPTLGAILSALHDAGLWRELEPYGGCYCFRPQSGASERLSTHSWGIAFDFRVTSCRRGTPGDMPLAIIEAFERSGAEWLGRLDGARCDPMHFQFCSGY